MLRLRFQRGSDSLRIREDDQADGCRGPGNFVMKKVCRLRS